MLVGFLHVGPDDSMARLMVKSAIRLGYDLLQMTDEDSPVIEGVGRIVRLPWNKRQIMLYRMRHLALTSEPMLVVDTDILFVKDVSDVWEQDFDAILTKREGPIWDKNGQDVAKIYPYNCGVMFCRNPAFWRRAYEICQVLPDELKDWYGDQEAIKWAMRDFNVLELPCREWNYTPPSPDKLGDARILHLKGGRKWMQAEIAKQMGLA